ncbi:hypothetical protein ACF1HJ_38440 [Streptomyces sp. NPDC013978]|uniref:hypothetical protein n=1 Tax=Streptomyces sp. NPDC013978 TaxID=3364869 RepID=UPI003701F0D9
MSLPGFTTTDPPAPAGDRVVPQFITCEEELGPVCQRQCERSWNPTACVRKCIAENCYGPYEPT